jgi:four helix bundle protein
MEQKAVGFKKLLVWQEAHLFVLDIYKISRLFPKQELFGLMSQIQRAAVSVPANIAEGSARNSRKEFLQFLFIAQGSLSEVEYYLELVKDIEYISKQQYLVLEEKRYRIGKLLHGLIVSLKSR